MSGQFLARPQYPLDKRLGRACGKPINVLSVPGIEAGGNQTFIPRPSSPYPVPKPIHTQHTAFFFFRQKLVSAFPLNELLQGEINVQNELYFII